MKYLKSFLILLYVAFTSCESEVSQKALITEDKYHKIDQVLKRYLELERFSGTVLITTSESILFKKSYGFANYESAQSFTDQTSFKIGELSELITSEIVYELAQKGHFELRDKVNKYLPEIKSEFTISDLLLHQTGLRELKTIRQTSSDLEYNTLKYTNLPLDSLSESDKSELNYNILGLLIEAVSGKSFDENIRLYSLSKSLKATYFQKAPGSQEATAYVYGNLSGKGLELKVSEAYNLQMAFSSRGLKSSAQDLAKIIHSNPHKDVDIYGFLSNDGFSYSAEYQASNGIAIIVLSNRRHPVAREISKAINSILKGENYQIPLARKPFKLNPDLLNEYAGFYQFKGGAAQFKVLKEDDGLFVLFSPHKMELIPQSENQFYMPDHDAAIRFERDSTNRVISALLLNGFIESEERAFKIDPNTELPY